MILLIHPPVAKLCEPPAGITRLAGMLGGLGVGHRLLDANLEGLLHMLRLPLPPETASDVWSRRAFRNVEKNISSLRDPALYNNIDSYKRCVSDLGRVLEKVSPGDALIGLSNYEHKKLSPIKSSDLLYAAEKPELDPFYPYFSRRFEALFREKEPRYAGISLNYLSQALASFAIAGFIRRKFPKTMIIMGGGLITSWMKKPGWKNPFSGLIDHLVEGPGEARLAEILDCYNSLSFPLDGNPSCRALKKNAGRAGMMDECPDYSLLPNADYLSPGLILPYAASSGCWWNRCGFCPEKAEGNPYRAVSSDSVMSDLTGLIAENTPALLHFLDNAVSPALMDALIRNPPGVPWYGFARVDRRLADPDFCRDLKKSGCVMLKLGLESGDQKVLDRLDKGISLDTASRALWNLKKAGIATYVYLLFGTPPETEEAAVRTLDFTARHAEAVGFLNLAVFNMPICGGEAEIETRGFYEGDLSLYTDFRHPLGWERKKVRGFLEKDFKRHPAIAAILKKDPPVFTSNHAPFFASPHPG